MYRESRRYDSTLVALFGQYEVFERIGAGGMAEVYRVRVNGIDGFSKELVLKKILPVYAADEEFRQMFVGEARVSAELRHANIVQILDFGKVDGTTSSADRTTARSFAVCR